MSELKEWTASEIEEYDDARLELAEDGKIDCTRVYIKSDVDAAIEELKAKLAEKDKEIARQNEAWNRLCKKIQQVCFTQTRILREVQGHRIGDYKMSELKARTARSIADEEEILELGADCPIEQAQVYLKSEADKVFAEKDAEIAELQKQVHDYAQGLYVIQAKAEKEARHDKHKRCLAMADYCYTNVHCIMGHRLCAFSDRKKEWFERWHNRWLAIAEKFKGAK